MRNAARRMWVSLVVGAAVAGGALRAGPVTGDERGQGSAKQGSAKAREQALVELGRRLFFDPRLSRIGARSCASCHDPEHGYSDPSLLSDDELGATRRHSQTLLDSWRNPNAHWDGEFATVERLVLARIGALPGGQHGGKSELLTAAERRERVREGRRPSSIPVGGSAGGRTGGGSVAPPARGSGPDPQAGAAPASGAASEPASATPPASPPGSAPAAAEPEEEEGTVIPIPRDNPGYVGRFANPTGAVANGLRKPRNAPPADGGPPPTPAPTPPTEGDGADPEAPAEGAEEAPEAPQESTTGEAPAKTPPAEEATPPPPAEEPEATEHLDPRVIDDLVSRLVPVARELEHNARYAEGFRAAFGSESVNDQRISEAIGAYVRSIRSTDSAYDAFVAGDSAALSPLAVQGLALFRGRAGCVQCHSLESTDEVATGAPFSGAPFSDYAFHNTGIAWNGLDAATLADLRQVDREADAGRAAISTRPAERRAFKTPTLRDVARRAPYMHDGSLTTLSDVVRHYAKGGGLDPQQADPQLDMRLKPFAANEQEVAALVAFLESLSNVGTPGRVEAARAPRATETTLTFVDAHGRALEGIQVGLVPVGDLLLVRSAPSQALSLTTDDRGRISFRPPTDRTHVQVVLDGAFGGVEASWVPDTCREATVHVPVLGRARLVLSFAAGAEPPPQLVVEHPGVDVLPGRSLPRTLLTRVGRVEGQESEAMLYAGWVRSDLPTAGRLRLSASPGGARDVKLSPVGVTYLDLRARSTR